MKLTPLPRSISAASLRRCQLLWLAGVFTIIAALSGVSTAQAAGYGIGNLVFVDANGDGHYSAGEGVGGVRVELWQEVSDPENPWQFSSWLQTDSSGAYTFQDIPAGTYMVVIPTTEFEPGKPLSGKQSVPGVQFSGDDDTGEDGVDTFDPLITGVNSLPIVVGPGFGPSGTAESGFQGGSDDADDSNTDLTIDFGFYQPLGIGNTIFADTNGNGNADPGEGIPNVAVQLYLASQTPGVDAPYSDIVTDADGHFMFGGLTAGSYKLHIPASQFAEGGILEGALSVVGVGQPGDDDDATGSGHLGDNGIDDSNPPVNGISSGTVTLLAGSAPTAATGETGQASSDDDNWDADYDLTIDLGFTFPANKVGVGNLVFFDYNSNGVYDDGEGVGDVLIELFVQGQDPMVDNPVATRTTSVNGFYLFGSIDPGNYFLHIPKSEFVVGKPLFSALSLEGVNGVQVGDDNVGEDGINQPYPELTGISTPGFTLAVGTAPTGSTSELGGFSDSDDFRDADVDMTRDFGFVRRAERPLSVGNLVFRDLNQNGHLDAGELGIEGVPVALFHEFDDPLSATPVATQVTASNGTYMFSNLTPGRYFVHIAPEAFGPAGALQGMLSSPGNGGDTNDDDNTDENGIDSATPAVTGINSIVFTLAEGTEPNETGFAASMDDADELNGDLTIDFGFAKDCGVISITQDSLPSATKDAPYLQTFTQTGGSGSIVWSVLSGTLPSGLSVNLNGDLSGTPGESGSFTFTVRAVINGECQVTKEFTLSVLPASNLGVGNTIFVDANGNGHFDAGEGLSGVLIELFMSGDDPDLATPLATTTSASEGIYLFDSLAPGSYFVHIPATQFQSGQPLFQKVSAPGHGKDGNGDDDANEDGIDSPNPAATGISSIDFLLEEGTEPNASSGETGHNSSSDDTTDANIDLTIDLGFISAPEVSVGLGNMVFRDDNNNHVYDDGEGIDGVVLQLFLGSDDPLTATPQRVTTSANGGYYSFMGLAPGTYKVFVPGSQFAKNGPLYGCVSITGNGTDAAGDDNVDENGIDSATPVTSGIVTGNVVLALGAEPTNTDVEKGAGATSDDLADNNTDLTVDLGFVRDCHTIAVSPGTLPTALYNQTINVELQATGGVGPYFFVFAYGTLPTGVVLDSSGVLSGQPSVYGTYQFGVQVIDDYGCFTIVSYTLEVSAPPLAVGNLVFFDRNANGRADEGEGVDGVTVQLFTSTQTPGVDAPVAQAVTAGGGRYLIDNLAPGLYQLHVPASMFASGAPLWQMKSVPGTVDASDDESGEDGQDAVTPSSSGVSSYVFSLQPGLCPTGLAESGLSGASDDTRDSDIDLTQDFGFVDAVNLPATFASWQTGHSGVSGPTGNDDGDGLNNLMEYIFGENPFSGVQATIPAFRCVKNPSTGAISVELRIRHGGLADLSYSVQILNNLTLSPGGWAATSVVPSVVLNTDGTETWTYSSMESDIGLAGSQYGFVRVHAILDANHDNVAEATGDSFVLGWEHRSLETRIQTYTSPFAAPAVFTGTVDGVSGSSFLFPMSAGGANLQTLFLAGYEYYAEVLNGSLEGQRWEIDEAATTGSTVALLPTHSRSTMATLPVELLGSTIALRAHWRVADVFPPADYHATTSAATSDNLLFWDATTSSYTTLWLVSIGGARWLKVAGGSVVQDANVVGPCDGVFAKPRIGVVNSTSYGLVRTWKVACPLKAGYNFVGNPFPVAQSPSGRLMTTANGFTGNTTATASDRVLVWLGDASAATGYDSYYLLKGPSIERWVKNGTTDQSNNKIFGANTAVFLISQLGQSSWVIPPAWTP